jgi:hypothetical protein
MRILISNNTYDYTHNYLQNLYCRSIHPCNMCFIGVSPLQHFYLLSLFVDRLRRTLLPSPPPLPEARRPRRSGLLRRSRTRPTTWLSSTSRPMNVCSRKFLPTSSSPSLSSLTVSVSTAPLPALLFASSRTKVLSAVSPAMLHKSFTVSLTLLLTRKSSRTY